MQQIMSHLSAIKKDMILLEKSEFSTLRHNYEVITFNLLDVWSIILLEKSEFSTLRHNYEVITFNLLSNVTV